ncbi:putative membrane protein [Proteiniphilum saccharofermentans]|uniref:histidine kinase n=1 Tax=Proteiniphilum saccharofermentans TaxID=1642647 RepID=A0A1R3SY10_9BACT|nr:response regulator [Proteiniphilum saccharofermentans]SCD19810.1 putative membrane protein [Proteiniphilum saccharofermentans]SFK92144.1 Signal transduction histidine kinase [Porphyromonadaceae bacterium KH3CP3RA]
MDLFFFHLSGILPDNSLLFQVPAAAITLPTLSIFPFETYSERTGLYIGALLLLVITMILLRFFERIKSNRMLQQTEQRHNDIFKKITHEFRAPLTIILGLSKQLQEQKDFSNNNSLTYLNAIERQGRYLSEMVNQLLDVANLYAAEKTEEWKTGNIVAFVEMVSETFRLYAGQKEIDLYFFSDEKEIQTDFVPDYLNKILHNLLSNAVKYSDEGSRIYLILERNKKDRKKVIIKVVDHGKGISKEMLPHIFKLHYTRPNVGTETPAGEGIGLAIAKQLTEISGGTIRVESEEGKGTTFTVEMPVRRNEKQLFPHWKPEKDTPATMAIVKPPVKTEHKELITPEANENDPRPTILLVEDNKDTALYIRSMFHQEQYNIIYASNGEKAWNILNKQLPDIVITDAVMPKKSGIELCKEMKASPLLNHIPVIIISAKNRESDLIEGLKSGADSYIRKPFHLEELQVRVENLLENRQLLREKYRRTVLKEEKAASCDNINSDFLIHVTDIIHREMKNPDFTSVKLAQELAISVSQLNRKLNAATGYSSSVYILQVKLNHARKLLSTQNKTIGEVATECGIYDVNYFSRVFKRHIGVTPSQFKRLPQN